MLFSFLTYSKPIRKWFRSSILLSNSDGRLAAGRYAQCHYRGYEKRTKKFLPDWKEGATIEVGYAPYDDIKHHQEIIFENPPEEYRLVKIKIELAFHVIVETDTEVKK